MIAHSTEVISNTIAAKYDSFGLFQTECSQHLSDRADLRRGVGSKLLQNSSRRIAHRNEPNG
jgi:hypothetical protein